MARSEIILGTPPQGLGGDPPRVASTKINAMTLELYARTEAQKNQADETPNVLMKNGAWSWGAVLGTRALDLNALNVSQAVALNGTANTPFAHGSTTLRFPDGSMALALNWASTHQQQLVFSRTTSQIALRRKNANVWQPDDYLCIYPTGQTFLSIAQGGNGTTTGISDAAQTALNTKFDAAKAVLDPQSAGGLMSYTSNATGEIWKFLNGMMITSQNVTGAAGAWTAGVGVRYKDYSGALPASFFRAPRFYVTMQDSDISGRSAWVANANGIATAWQVYLSAGPATTGVGAVTFNVLAIGSWK